MNGRVAMPRYVDRVSAWLTAGAKVRLRLRGGSMRYSLPPGCELVVSPQAELRRGAIYVFRDGKVLVAHRLIAMVGSARATAILRGENADAAVERIAVSSILGEVTAVHRNGGWRPMTGPCRRMLGLLWASRPLVARQIEGAALMTRSVAGLLCRGLSRLMGPSRRLSPGEPRTS